jgi:hypothetical protein
MDYHHLSKHYKIEKMEKNSAYQGFKKFVFFSLTCSQIWLKPSCGRLPVHLPHKIAQQNENKKKKTW